MRSWLPRSFDEQQFLFEQRNLANPSITETLQKLTEGRKGGRPPAIKSANPWRAREVRLTPELARIAAIPRRTWEENGKAFSKEVTELLKKPRCDYDLYPEQAQTLYELWSLGRTLAVIKVGGGKSLITFLAPYVVRSFRPLLLLPGNLIEKTRRHMQVDSYNWEVCRFIRLESYEKIANPRNEYLLYDYQPDLFMADEISKAKDPTTVTAKTIGYYFKDCERGYYFRKVGDKVEERPLTVKPKRLGLTGTLFNDSLLNCWHILKWFLPDERMPLPFAFSELEELALCVDAEVDPMHRVKPGALLSFCNEEEKAEAKTNPLKAARKALRRRIIETPGVVSVSKPFLGSSLRIYAKEHKITSNKVLEAFKLIRQWKTPDGMEIQDAHIAAASIRQVALGFFYYWDPMPPKEYLEARKHWGESCRHIIARNKRRLTSEGKVVLAMKGPQKHYSEFMPTLEKWEYWRAKWGKPITKAKWLDDFAVDYAIQWMKDNPTGIVWTSHTAFARRLEKKSGIDYYGSKSINADGRFIEAHPHGTPMIASIKANYMGKNLQYGWDKSLIMSSPASGEIWEQLLGREHRMGQPSDEVLAELFVSCLEHYRAFWDAVLDAEFADDIEGDRKLIYADVTVPTLDSLANRKGPFWQYNEIKEVSE